MTIPASNLVLEKALAIVSGPGGINDQLSVMSLAPPLAPVGSILKLSAAVEAYEKTTSLKYPVVTLYCERLKNTQAERFRMFSGSALLVIEIRVTGECAEDLDTGLNSYVEAACQALDASRGAWTEVGTYAGGYDVKFQALRPGGKQFSKSARIEFEVLISR